MERWLLSEKLYLELGKQDIMKQLFALMIFLLFAFALKAQRSATKDSFQHHTSPTTSDSPFVQPAYTDSGLRATIRKMDLAHAHAIFEGDAIALDSLMDDDVTVNHPTGRIVKEKKELLDLIKQGVIRYTAFERIPETFLIFKDMVVVMGNETVVPAKGAPNAGKELRRRYTNVWMRRNGGWRLTVRHANNVCPGN